MSFQLEKLAIYASRSDFSPTANAHAMRSLIEGRSRRCDVLCLHHREGRVFFLNLLGWGFVTEVARRAVRHKRWGALEIWA